MSGEGFLAACWLIDPLAAALPANPERGDVVAYLEQRRDNCDTMAREWPDFEHEARVQRRQLDTIIGDFVAGMHEGAAGVRARLIAGAATPTGELPG